MEPHPLTGSPAWPHSENSQRAQYSEHVVVTAELKSGRTIREALERAYRHVAVETEAAQDFSLAVSEAFSNAICHGCSKPADKINVWLTVSGEYGQVRLEYRGEPFHLTAPCLPDDGSTNGRGRYLMQILADQVDYEFAGGWTRARLRKSW